MTIDIQSVDQISDEVINDLIMQNLSKIMGTNHEVIAPQLPFEGNHILAISAGNKPVIVTYDKADGGSALLSGIAALEKLTTGKKLIYNLYPRLSEIAPSNVDLLSMETIRLIILAPRTIAGAEYVTSLLTNVTVYSFQVLKVNHDIGLLIETAEAKDGGKFTFNQPADQQAEFRTGRTDLSQEEELFFQVI
jgi:hypothetical protein